MGPLIDNLKKEITRMISYIFEHSDGKQSGYTRYIEHNKIYFSYDNGQINKFLLKSHRKPNRYYEQVCNLSLDTSNWNISYTYIHDCFGAEKEYYTKDINNDIVILTVIHEEFSFGILPFVEIQALKLIRQQELQRVLSGKYERLEPWK